MPDYMPRGDGEFLVWEQNLVTYVNGNMAALGLLPADLVALAAGQLAWENAYAAHQAAAAAALSATEAKRIARDSFESAIRALVRQLQISPSVDDTERAAMGIPVRDTSPTPAAAPTTKPVLQADISNAQQIGLDFGDEGNPTSKAKPAGVGGVEIWAAASTNPPTADAQFALIAYDTNTPYIAFYDLTQVGQTIWFRARWVSTRGQKGPWGAMISARVPG